MIVRRMGAGVGTGVLAAALLALGCTTGGAAQKAACPENGETAMAPRKNADGATDAAVVLEYAEGTQVKLLPPRLDRGLPLMAALGKRSSSRSFAPDPIDIRTLSELLWAANGVNRPETGHRTAPTARDKRDLDVYVALELGLFRYAPEAHALEPVVAGDLRALTGVQEFAGGAPLDLIYVSDLAKTAGTTPEDKLVFAGSHAGFVSQNVYLYCASAGLATVVRAYVDKPALAAAMGLRPDQTIVLAQTVGWPGPPERAE